MSKDGAAEMDPAVDAQKVIENSRSIGALQHQISAQKYIDMMADGKMRSAAHVDTGLSTPPPRWECKGVAVGGPVEVAACLARNYRHSPEERKLVVKLRP